MTQDIIKYQEIDGKLLRLQKELNESSARKKATDMQNQLKAGQARLVEVERNASKAMENYQKANAYYGEMVAKIEALASTMEGADLTKIKELQQTNGNFFKMIDRLEHELAKLSAQLNMVSSEYNNIIKNAKIAKTELDNSRNKFAAEKTELEPKIAALQVELAAQEKVVDKAILEKYKAKRESKFPVIVRQVNGTCGGCRMAISAAKNRDLLSKGFCECENCGRIIYNQN